MADGDFELAKDLAKELGIEIPDEERPHLTDDGNARWLAILHGDELRYCAPTKEFHYWDDIRWKEDVGTIQVDRWVRDVAHHYYTMAEALGERYAKMNGEAARETDATKSDSIAAEAGKLVDIAKKYTSWGRKSETSERMSAIVRWGRSAIVSIEPREMDRDPWLLNCLNGTIDLRTGELREHRRDDLNTKVCPVEYDPDAGFTLWDDFLARVQPVEEIRQFLQRAAGYAITGLTTEEKLFFSYGTSSTGKSTFLQAIIKTLGDYALTADFDTFLQKDRSSGHTAEIARLAGSRLVVSIEMDEGKRLAEALVKTMTGGDEITARHMYSKSFGFDPTFQLWMAANHQPRVRADDAAMWRRIIQIPFDVVVPEGERDPGVKETLKDVTVAGPAILAWLVKGCLEWQREGLNAPSQILRATEQYREEMDPLSEFIAERCVLQPEARSNNGDIYQEYRKWAEHAGIRRAISQKAFTTGLKARNFEQHSNGKTKFWPGIGIIDDRLEE